MGVVATGKRGRVRVTVAFSDGTEAVAHYYGACARCCRCLIVWFDERLFGELAVHAVPDGM